MLPLAGIASAVVPAFLVVGLGAVLARRIELDIRTLTAIALYLLSPCLVFDAVSRRTDAGSFVTLAAGAVLITTLCLATGRLASTLVGAGRAEASSLTGSAAFINAGNMGMPIALFAYGEPGLARAAAFMVATAVMINTAGILVYSLGRTGPDAKAGLGQVARLPLVYAAGLGLALPAAGITLPPILARPVGMLGQAAIPVLLLAFGIQLGRMGFRRPRGTVWAGVGIRLGVSPLAAAGIVAWLRPHLPLDPLDAKVFILMSSLPPAVYNYLLAERLGGDIGVVSEVILWATILSFGSVALVLALLG